MVTRLLIIIAILISMSCSTSTPTTIAQNTRLRALIIDGQNNHDTWPMTTAMMRQYLRETGLYEVVDVERTKYTWQGREDLLSLYPIEGMAPTIATEKPRMDPDYSPAFDKYDVVISNFGWNAAPWPVKTQQALERYVAGGGGFVVVHAADNSWPEWIKFNEMIALGGWGNRDEHSGPYIYFDNDGELQVDGAPGKGGSHGAQHEFIIEHRDINHPITAGLPSRWLHAKDELYDRLRGPAKQLDVLATAYAAPEQGGTDRHEPMIMTIKHGQGRVFHTPLGHAGYSWECVGLLTIYKRGTEWAATGDVSQQSVPRDFPTETTTSSRQFMRR